MPQHPLARALSVPLMLLAGAVTSIQSQLNSHLAGDLGSGLRAGVGAALWSFGSGFVMLSVIALLTRSGRAGIPRLARAVRSGDLPWWLTIGGVLGAFFVASQSITVGTIGVALFIVAYTAGQSSASLLVDRLGLSPSGRHPLSIPRLVAAAFAIVAVALKASEQLETDAGALLIPFALLAIFAGLLTAVQQAMNGHVSRAAGSLATTWNNFFVGTTGLAVIFALSFLVEGELVGLSPDWWAYLGGLCGMFFIWTASWTVHVHGVLVLALCAIAGQVVAAEIIELVVGEQVGMVGLLGGGLTLLGVVIALAIRPAVRAA